MTHGQRIPATIVTGFLGAGKTTLIRRLMSDPGGRRIALMINEFGEIGFDGGLLGECGIPGCGADEIVELTNGCICCTVAEDFLPAMEKLVTRDPAPDHLVIETSGLALPQPLIRAFAWPDIRHRVTVDAVVVVADAAAIASGTITPEPPDVLKREAATEADHDDPVEELFHDQIRSADLIVVSKADLLDPAAVADVERRLRAAARPQTAIVRSDGTGVPVGVLLGLGAAAEDDLTVRWSQHEREGEAHDHDDFTSFVTVAGECTSLDEVRDRVGAALAVAGVLRIKGRISIAGKAVPAMVQAVGARIETWFGQGNGPAELVVIGASGIVRDEVERALRS